MSRDVKYEIQNSLEGQTVYFLRITYPSNRGGGESVRGPYMGKKPAIPKYIKNSPDITAAIEEYILVKK